MERPGILSDGSVVTWGDPEAGGDSSLVKHQLKSVVQVQATGRAFAAVLALAVSSLACWHSALACQHSRAQHSLQCIFPGVHPSRYVYLDLDSGCFYWNRKNALE